MYGERLFRWLEDIGHERYSVVAEHLLINPRQEMIVGSGIQEDLFQTIHALWTLTYMSHNRNSARTTLTKTRSPVSNVNIRSAVRETSKGCRRFAKYSVALWPLS